MNNDNKNNEIIKDNELDASKYLTLKEERAIARKNRKTIKALEKRKRRKNVDESEYTTTMKNADNIVEFDLLHTSFFTDIGEVKAVNGVSFEIPRGKVVGVVGESGCGKSVTSLSLMQLVQAPQGQIVSGAMRYNAKDGKCYDIAKIPIENMKKIRGREISMIFQEPMTSLNPVFTIGEQIDEVFLLHNEGVTAEEAKEKSLAMLKLVGIAMHEKIYSCYPHELSGGMRQRVMIAIALACDPQLIIADEPTTALDVTIQAQILDLLRDLQQKSNSSIMLITHDLGVVAGMADYVVVMYAGRIIEKGTVADIFHNPKHPYTVGLMKSRPNMLSINERLYSIPGQVPNPINMPNHCYFSNRCEHCMDICLKEYPEITNINETHSVSCYLFSQDKGGAK